MTNQLDTAFLVAVLFGCGVYLCMSRRLLRVLFGFLMVSNAANLVLLGVSGDPTGRTAALIGAEGMAPANGADPLPQALILTAIVIGFAIASYLTVLIYRIYTDRRVATMSELYAQGAPAPDTPAEREEQEEGIT